MTKDHSKARKGFAFAHIALGVAVLAAFYLLAIMVVTRLGYVGYDLGFRMLTLSIGPKVAMAAFIVSALSLLISLFMSPGRRALWALMAVVVSGGLIGGFYAYKQALKIFPPIADVATDWDRPLTFSDKLVAARGPEALRIEDLPRVPRNASMAWGGKTVADINQLTCPGARPVLNKALTEDQISSLLTEEHYIVTNRGSGWVEATHKDYFYGFASDVIVRTASGRVDVRSVSRYDMPDLGGNCRRVTRLVNRIKAL